MPSQQSANSLRRDGLALLCGRKRLVRSQRRRMVHTPLFSSRRNSRLDRDLTVIETRHKLLMDAAVGTLHSSYPRAQVNVSELLLDEG
jgi:hypothetical protein